MADANRLLEKLACIDLIEKVRRAADEGDVDTFVNSFTEDGVWARPGGAAAMEGREAIRATMSNRPEGRLSLHVGGGIDATLTSPDTATVVSQVTFYATTHTGPPPAPIVPPSKIFQYTDQLVRTPEGWRIKHRTTTWIFSG